MPSDLNTILRLEAPIIVEIGARTLNLKEVMALSSGAIIELPKRADEELELKVNNKTIGTGFAVKVGENFGLQITFIGDARSRLAAIAGGHAETEAATETPAPAPEAHAGADAA
ncbi:MAG: FliM/FliN family flagellar motor switch protein [Phycisphaerales bacterium]